MPPCQAVLNPLLAFEQPVQCLVGLALLHLAQTQHRAQARCRGLLVHRADKPEFGTRRDQPVHDHRHHQIAMSPRLRVLRRAQDQPVQRDPAKHAERRGHVAMRQRSLDPHLVRSGADHRAAPEQRSQTIDDIVRQFAQVGQRALLRASLLIAVALPQQHRWRRRPIGHRLDEHRPNRITSRPIWESLHGHKIKSSRS